MKTVPLRLWIMVLILSLFSQNLLATAGLSACSSAPSPLHSQEHAQQLSQKRSQQHLQQHCQQPASPSQAEHITTPADHQHAAADHQCQPGCHCCPVACSPGLPACSGNDTRYIPATETYAFQLAHPPASPIESTIKPPCFS